MRSKYLFFILCFLLPSYSLAQSNTYEQNAVNYFFANLFDSIYPKMKQIEFSGFTEERITKVVYGDDCFNPDSYFTRALHNNAERLVAEKKKLDIKSNKLKVKKVDMESYKRFKLRITCANEVEGKVYINIELYKIHEYIDVYFFELSKNGNIIRWCKTGAGF